MRIEDPTTNLNVAGDLVIGRDASPATMTVANGAHLTTGRSYVGEGDAATDATSLMARVTGTGSRWNAGNFFALGGSASSGASLTIEDGGLLTANTAAIGRGGPGAATITGAQSELRAIGTLSVGSFFNGHKGDGTLTVENGGLVTADTLLIANDGADTGVFHLNGTTAARGIAAVGSLRKGDGDAFVRFDGGVLRATQDTTTFIDGFDPGDLVIDAGGLIVDTDGYDVTASSGLSGTGSLTKTGTGTLSLTGANDYAGSTTVSGGTLSVEGGGSITSTPTLTVAGTDARLRVDGVGSSSTISNTALIGSAAEAGELIISQGGTFSSEYLRVSSGPATPSTVVVTDANSRLVASTHLRVGIAGHGDMTVSDGARVSVGSDTTVDHHIVVGLNASGTLTVSGAGTLVESSNALFAGSQGGHGIVVLQDGAQIFLEGAGMIGHDDGTGALVIDDANWHADTTSIGNGVNATGTLTATGANARIVSNGAFTLGVNEGTGHATLANDALATANQVLVGRVASTGTLEVDHARLQAAQLIVAGLGADSDGTITIRNGSTVSANRLNIATEDASARGEVTITGTGTTVELGVQIAAGLAGSGTLTIADGADVKAPIVEVGVDAGSVGAVSLVNATLTTGQVAAGSGSAAFRFDGGTLVSSGAQTDLFAGFADNAVTLDAGGGTIDTQGFDVASAAVIGGSGGLTKAGTGTLTLTGANRYAGPTTVRGGVLRVDGDQSGATGLMTVEHGATLGGGGIIGGDVIIADGATLAPGQSPGTLTINGDLSLAAGSILNFELGEANVPGGPLNDLVNVGGDLTLAGTLNVIESAGGTFGPGVYRVFNYGGALGGPGLTLGTMPAGSNLVVQTAVAGQVNLANTEGVRIAVWDGAAGAKDDGTITGGDGVWRMGGGDRYWTDIGGTVNADYTDGSFAIFQGSGGMVTLDGGNGPVTASGLQFATDGYVIGGDALTLMGPQSIIRVGDGSGAEYSATIEAELIGATQLVKEDAGALVLTGDNRYSGGTVIQGGTLVVSRDANLGDASGHVELDGGALRATDSFTSQRTITLAGPGAILADESATLTLNGALSGNGVLTKRGAGTLILTGDNSAYVADTHVTLGTLTVDGALGGRVDVAAGARLEGIGRVGGIINAGTVAPGSSGFGALTVAGDYVGQGGTLEIETALGDDASPTDRLVIDGHTSGTTRVSVVNRGGLGAPTLEGIKIVDVAGASDGTFTLNGDYLFEGDPAVIAGAYAYRLYKNGIADPADGDWYLRSSLVDPDDASPISPAPSVPLYQPGVPVYEGYAQTLLRLNDLPTLEGRVGNRVWGGDSVEGGGGVWGRIEGMRHRPKAAFSTSGADKDIDSWQMQVGVERTLVQRGDDATLIGALTAHYGKASSRVTSVFGNGSIDAEGYGVGATLSWYGPQGVYVDGQVQFGWSSSDLHSGILGTLASNNHGTGKAFGIEAGRRVPIGAQLSLTPQIQMIYAHVDFDRFTDAAGAVVSVDEARSVRTRWGLSLDHQVTTAQNRSSHLYGIVNLSYEWQPNSSVRVSGTQIVNRERNLWGELGLGGTYSWNDHVTLYAQGSAETALGDFGSGYAMKGTMGFRVVF